MTKKLTLTELHNRLEKQGDGALRLFLAMCDVNDKNIKAGKGRFAFTWEMIEVPGEFDLHHVNENAYSPVYGVAAELSGSSKLSPEDMIDMLEEFNLVEETEEDVVMSGTPIYITKHGEDFYSYLSKNK